MIEENVHRAKDKNLDSELQSVKELLATYQEYIYQSSCNPAVYRALGLENGLQLRTEALENNQRIQLLRPWSEGLADYFTAIEL